MLVRKRVVFALSFIFIFFSFRIWLCSRRIDSLRIRSSTFRELDASGWGEDLVGMTCIFVFSLWTADSAMTPRIISIVTGQVLNEHTCYMKAGELLKHSIVVFSSQVGFHVGHVTFPVSKCRVFVPWINSPGIWLGWKNVKITESETWTHSSVALF